MRALFIFFVCLSGFTVSAQDLSGIWRGHFKSDNESSLLDSLGIEDRYKFEVQLDQKDKAFKGVTYSYKTTVFYGKASCFGAINKQTKKVLLEETKILEVKTAGGVACIMTCFLQYSKAGDEEFLEGHYTSMSTADSSRCGKGTVFLRKVTTSDFYKEPFLVQKEKEKNTLPQLKKSTAPLPKKTPPLKPGIAKTQKPKVTSKPKVPAPDIPKKYKLAEIPKDSLGEMPGRNAPQLIIPHVLSTRENELVRTITTSAKNIYIKIYDNGAIDNDTVSVYLDKKLVISKQRLTEKAITLKVNLDDSIPFHELVMVAENLGEIPPNTSLMVVNAGDQQYEVRITSTEQKNAVVLFKYQP